MADIIQIKAGAKGSRTEMPALAPRELGFLTDEKGGALYIGTESGNVFLCCADKAAGVSSLENTAALSEVITAVNSIITSLKNSGVMSSE